jgi:hypothetical protein
MLAPTRTALPPAETIEQNILGGELLRSFEVTSRGRPDVCRHSPEAGSDRTARLLIASRCNCELP